MKFASERVEKWWLVALAALALVLRLPLLTGSFWLDEAAQALESVRPLSEQFDLAYDFQPPLYHLIVHAFSHLGRAEWWLRLSSLLPGVASVVLMAVIGARLAGRKAGLLTATLMAVSPWMIFYSQELRPYMLAVFFAVCAGGSWLAWLQSSGVNARRWLMALSIFLALGMLTSYVFLFFIPAVLIATLIWQPKKVVVVGKAIAVSSMWFLLWWPGFLQQWKVGQELRQTLPGWESVVSLLPVKALPVTIAKFFVGLRPLDSMLLDGVSVVVPLAGMSLGAILLVWKWIKTQDAESIRRFLVAASLLIVPLMLSWMFSVLSPVLQPKRVLYVLPWLFLMAGFIAQYGKRWGEGVLLVVLVLQVFGTAQYWMTPALQREDWRGVIRTIEEQFSTTNTAVVFAFDAPFAPWRWYARESFTLVTTRIAPLATAAEARQYLTPTESYDHVLVFDYLRDLTDPQSFLTTTLRESGYQEEGALGGGQLGFVRLYVKQALYASRSI